MKQQLLQKIQSTFSLRQLQEYTLTLHQLERRVSFPDFDASTRYCMEMLKETGFSKIERICHRADGRTSAFDCVMPEAWELAGRSFLEITSSSIPEYERMLADTNHHPIAATIWSAPTPADGVDCELVDYDSLDSEHPDVKGKWVFYAHGHGSSFDGKVYQKLANAGAVGMAVTDFKIVNVAPDDLFWFNGHGVYGWYHVKEDPRIPVFSIAPRRALKLKEQLAAGKITVHAEMNTRIYDGEIYTVTAIIPGESETEYALFAHLYEPFAADDSLGFGMAAEIGRIINQIKIRPKKTLRVVFSMELYGFSAFFADEHYSKKIVAALNLDGFSHLANRKISFCLSPVSNPFFGDWYYPEFFRGLLQNFDWQEKFASLSDDTFCGDPCINIPTNWLYNPSSPYHHNTGVFFQPDWRAIEEGFPILAAAVINLLTIGDEELKNFESIALCELETQLTGISADRSLTSYEQKIRVKTFYDYQLGRLRSIQRFAQIVFDEQKFNELRKKFDDKIVEIQINELLPVERHALNTVVTRLRLGTPFSQADIPYAERQYFHFSRLLFSLFDGNRTLLEALRMVDAVSGSKTSIKQIEETMDSLRYLEKYGYVKLRYTGA